MNKKFLLVIRVIVAIILVQTLRFKFTAHPDSVYIFSTLGLEPFGRIGIGVVELIASILILIPKTVWLGAGISVCALSGAVYFHLTTLGIEVQGDGGTLFSMAFITLILSIFILGAYRNDIPVIGNKLGTI